MTIENLLYRFLKENKIYSPIKKQIENANRLRKIKTNNLIPFWLYSSGAFKKDGIKCLFYERFRDNVLFCGDHNTAKRRRFYKLNKKWKEMVDNKCYLQHNVDIGDEITFMNFYGTKRDARILKSKSYLFHVKDEVYGYEYMINIMSIKSVKNKDFFINLYYKDENGQDYGKIDGCYNEVQL